jgi:hypothetical protein
VSEVVLKIVRNLRDYRKRRSVAGRGLVRQAGATARRCEPLARLLAPTDAAARIGEDSAAVVIDREAAIPACRFEHDTHGEASLLAGRTDSR